METPDDYLTPEEQEAFRDQCSAVEGFQERWVTMTKSALKAEPAFLEFRERMRESTREINRSLRGSDWEDGMDVSSSEYSEDSEEEKPGSEDEAMQEEQAAGERFAGYLETMSDRAEGAPTRPAGPARRTTFRPESIGVADAFGRVPETPSPGALRLHRAWSNNCPHRCQACPSLPATMLEAQPERRERPVNKARTP